MNQEQFEGKWTQLKGSLTEKWGKLTNDEVDQVKGNKQKLMGLIQEKYGIAKEEAEKEIDTWAEQKTM